MGQFTVRNAQESRPKSGAMVTFRFFANVTATVEIVLSSDQLVRCRFSDGTIQDRVLSAFGPWRAATRNEIFDWRADVVKLHLDRNDVEGRWDDAVDWLLNLPPNSGSQVQDLFWGIVDGEYTRTQIEEAEID